MCIRDRTTGFVQSYSTATLSYGSFDRVRTTSNDLHNMLAVVAGDPAIANKLANKNAAMALRQRQTVPVLAIRRYLRDFKGAYAFLTKLESALGINNTDYRNLRRAIADYSNLSTPRKKATTTRLLQALKAKLSGTDIQRKTQEFADKQKLELDNVIDAERTVPGVEMTPDELTAYRVLVGSNNVRRAKIAAELIQQGKVATIELNVPPVNAFNSEEWHQFAKLVDDLSFSEEVNSLVIRAQGKGFCAGVDIKELQKDGDKIYEVNDGCWKLGRAIHNCNVPVISACHGFVLGGGILIAGASDIVLATKDACLLYTSPSPRDRTRSRMPSSA